jgi:hypothetical protein
MNPFLNSFSGTLFLLDDSAIASVKFDSSTGSAVAAKAYNRAVAPASYTFVTSLDQYQKIFSGQCNRVYNYIHGQLESVDQSEDSQTEMVIDNIANVIDLVGEPASCTAVFEASLLKDNLSIFEPLLLAIGAASHKESEADRANVLSHYTQDSNYSVRRAAVRALGRMSAPAAKKALTEISIQKNSGEIGLLAAAYLR